MPPAVLTSRVCQATAAMVGEGVDVAVGGAVVPVVDVELDSADVEVVVVDATVVLVVVDESTMAGAATLSGAMGRSLTRLSAALTICQVRVVASPTTTSQPKKRENRLTSELSQTSPARLLNGVSRFHQARPGGNVAGII